MGDRCSVTVTLHGHIETIEVFKEVVEAIHSELLVFDSNAREVATAMREAAEDNTNPYFEADEVNYGNIEPLEDVLKAHRIDYHVDQSNGDNYPGEARSYCSSDDSYEKSIYCFGDAVFYANELTAAVASSDCKKFVEDLLASADRSRGVGLPSFSLGHEVRGWLAIGGPDLEPKKETP